MAEERTGDFGSTLRAARERRGLTLRQIADATKISHTVLEALERNDLSRLPGGIFSRAFVRSYALEVGLDPERAIEDFIAQFPPDSVTAGHARADDVEDHEAVESERRMASVFLKLVLVSVPIAGVVLYLGTRGREERNGRAAADQTQAASVPAAAETHTERLPAVSDASSTPAGAGLPSARQDSGPEPRDASPPAAAPAPKPPTPPAAAPPAAAAATSPATVTPGLPATKPGASDTGAASNTLATTEPGSPPAAPAAETRRVSVEIVATRDCRVSATVDGAPETEVVLSAGERRTFRASRELELNVGDASAITWTVNGEPARALGASGEAATVRLTPANYMEYVSPR